MWYICIMETWKVIIEADRYEISNHGRVRKIKTGKILKCCNHKGYRLFRIKGFRKTIHRLVAQYFMENINNKPYINHIDSNRSNNHIDNLEWCTPIENTHHGIYLGTIDCRKILNTKTGEVYASKLIAAMRLGVTRSVITHMVHGRIKNRFGIEFIDKQHINKY